MKAIVRCYKAHIVLFTPLIYVNNLSTCYVLFLSVEPWGVFLSAKHIEVSADSFVGVFKKNAFRPNLIRIDYTSLS